MKRACGEPLPYHAIFIRSYINISYRYIVAPQTIAPAAVWYDHFVNLALASIIRTEVKYELDDTGLPPTYATYDDWLKQLRRKPGEGGTAMLPIHTKAHSCYAGATARSMHYLNQIDQAWLPNDWQHLDRFQIAQISDNALRDHLLAIDMSNIPENAAEALEKWQSSLTKVFIPEKDAGVDEDEKTKGKT